MSSSERRTALELLRVYQARPSAEGLDRLLETCHPLVRQLVARQLPRRLRRQREVEDLVQEALLDVLRGVRRFVPGSERAFRSWLATIVRNNLRDHERHAEAAKRGGARVLHFSELAEPERLGSLVDPRSLAGLELGASELAARLTTALGAMPERYREALVLRRLRGLAYDEIARRLGYAGASSARAACTRAARMLRERLDRSAGTAGAKHRSGRRKA